MLRVTKVIGSVCNACMSNNTYKIMCTPNGQNGCTIYLCDDCLGKALWQVAMIKASEIIEGEKENED